MHRSIRRAVALVTTLAVVLGGALVGAPMPVPRSSAGTVSPILPDLKVLPLSSFHVERLNGQRLLRFTTIVANRGPGPFEIRGSRRSTAEDSMRIRQVIFEEGGGTRTRRTGVVATYAGDGHDHWHVRDVTSYELWPVGVQDLTLRGVKIGLCFFDNYVWRPGLPGAPDTPQYDVSGCSRSVDALRVHAGISVGWGDNYPWNFAYQWIDITGLPGGRYMLRTTVDQGSWYREHADLNNCVWVRLRISDPADGNRVRVLDRGGGCSAASVSPVTDFPGSRTWKPVRPFTYQPGTYTGFSFNSRGTVLRTKTLTLDSTATAAARRRATPPGRQGRWLYVVDGPLSGRWVKVTEGITLGS